MIDLLVMRHNGQIFFVMNEDEPREWTLELARTLVSI